MAVTQTRDSLDEAKRLALIAEAVRYCQRVAALGMPVSCYSKALREPVFFLWECRNGPKAKAAQYRSRAAMGRRHGRGELVYDHAVPFALLQAELLALQPVTEAAVESVLSRFGTTVLITKEENDHLNRLGYGRSMPAGWNRTDPLARYKAAGIDLVENATSG
jgi:hypothetical protein